MHALPAFTPAAAPHVTTHCRCFAAGRCGPRPPVPLSIGQARPTRQFRSSQTLRHPATPTVAAARPPPPDLFPTGAIKDSTHETGAQDPLIFGALPSRREKELAPVHRAVCGARQRMGASCAPGWQGTVLRVKYSGMALVITSPWRLHAHLVLSKTRPCIAKWTPSWRGGDTLYLGLLGDIARANAPLAPKLQSETWNPPRLSPGPRSTSQQAPLICFRGWSSAVGPGVVARRCRCQLACGGPLMFACDNCVRPRSPALARPRPCSPAPTFTVLPLLSPCLQLLQALCSVL